MLCKWSELPDFMKTKQVRKYYQKINKKRGTLLVKRLFDVCVSFLMLLILSPVLLVLSVWIKIDSRGPVFYRQERVTQYGRTFKIFKFRTMVQNADKIGSLVTIDKDPRITKVGEKIRKYRLDELPQLINILIGDMTFVGTRPEVLKYVKQYTDEMNATLLLPAGVTSLASIEYRNEDEIINSFMDKYDSVDEIYINEILEDKMKYNLKALRKFSLFGEIKILIKTVIKVF